ncbi:hypothetical protein L6452_32624 [Arctium lappa]|uniref:Uncharacterized protein n=1 Tax=Arctium lappa TaxID=4217 RepID=A0ACB8Z601_ARCLA|nr:hypothetical protein L6452_32624 [Arctium lappa]
MLSSSQEVRTAVSLKMACSRSSKQVQQLNYSVWNVNSAISSSTLLESTHTSASMQRSRGEKDGILWNILLCRLHHRKLRM